MKRDKKAKDRDDMLRPCFIALYDLNDPHLKTKAPKQILEYKKVDKVNLDNFRVNYLLAGNDLVINNLVHIDVVRKGSQLILNGRQKVPLLKKLF
jgi:hypothetical protein